MSELDLADMKRFSPEASTFTDGGLRYIDMPKLRLPDTCTPQVVNALLCMDQREGYPTRLFFSAPIHTPTRAITWQTVSVAGTTWYAYSWNNVPSTTPVAVLIGHLHAFAA